MQINVIGRRRWKISMPALKTVLYMKLTAAFLLLGCLQLSANGFSQKVTLAGKNISLEKALVEIGEQSGYFFFYRYNELKNATPLNIRLKNVPLKTALEELFRDQPFSYAIDNKTIVVVRKQTDIKNPLPELPPVDIRGRVVDERGNPMPGATVRVKGTNNATVSNAEGEFSIPDLPDGTVLVITYTGYLMQEVVLKKNQPIRIVLKEDDNSLKSVVVVGYGTQERKDITGAVASLPSKKIKDQPVTSMDAALAGQIAGVQVAQTTGTPGGGVTVRVRGAGSLTAGNEPLYVIDGFPVTSDYNQTNNPLNSINPNDIESVQVLKDASATAIYGSRGSNGVIIITTKSGKSGTSRVNLDMFTGFQEVAKKIDMLDAQGFANYINETRNNAWVDRGGSVTDNNTVRNNVLYRLPPFLADPAALGKGTDWQDEIFQKAPIRNVQLSFSGGNEKTKYYMSAGYLDQDGVVINGNFKRYSFKLNVESQVSDRIKVGANLTPSFTTSDVVEAEGHWSGGAMILSALLMAPHLPVYNPDGSYTNALNLGYGFSSVENPVKSAKERVNKWNRMRLLGTGFAEVELLKDLKFKILVGADFASGRNRTFIPSIVGRDGAPPPSIPVGTSTTNQSINWLSEYTLAYKKSIDRHQFDALLGYTAQKDNFESNFVSATNFPNDNVQTINAGIINGGSSDQQQWALLSYLARVNYSFDRKYLLTATIRRDGSSRFGANNKWGTFPSVSAGWRISDESFMQGINWMDELRLRASYGVTGNNFIGNYAHIALLSAQNYILGTGSGQEVNGLYPSTFGNVNLGWEMNKQLDLGFELGVFNNRVVLTADYYDKRTSKLLLNVPVPSLTGFTTATQNIGKIRNHGVELSLATKNTVGAFKWNTDINVSFNRNKVLALGPEGAPIFGNYQLNSSHKTEIGQPMGNFYGYKVIGVFQDAADLEKSPRFADSQPGHLKFEDINGDGVLSTDDRTILGNPFPDMTFGINNNFSYKGFELNILLQGVQGFEVMNLGRRFYANYAGTGNGSADMLNAWRSPQDPGNGNVPRLNRDLARYTSSNASANITSLFVEDASFLRIRNVSLGYNLNEKLASLIRARSARLYVSAQNLHTFTSYKGYNPEVSVTGASTLTPGVDYGGYPVARTFTVGLNLGF
ncbi:MAG: TonB-dependent receptor [Flavipsychrobacter sp.]|nr:TonB-dependent receptor [Flavipsychrobacter sp.]